MNDEKLQFTYFLINIYNVNEKICYLRILECPKIRIFCPSIVLQMDPNEQNRFKMCLSKN